MSTNQQEWSDQGRITTYRLQSIAAVLWACAIALPFIAEATGTPFDAALGLATAGLIAMVLSREVAVLTLCAFTGIMALGRVVLTVRHNQLASRP